jgi:crotonobetainyl-CoA:carnitine CoA-transferase CaiB-like acyl-CoA transferase
MTEGAMALLIAELGNLGVGAPAPTRGAESLNGGLACYGVYQTSDGKYLSVGALEPKFWEAFNRTLGRPVDYAELVAPPAQQERIRGEIQAILSQKTRAEWEAVFAGADALCEPVLETDELEAHPLHRARRMFFTVDHPTLGPVAQLRTPVGEPRAARVAPGLGEHSAEVLGEYGFTPDEISALIRRT